MFFKKPSNVTYTMMAIYIDQHAYGGSFDETLIFQYLYHLFYILAVKKCYFKTTDDYDNYALYGAEEVYKRLTNPRQFLSEDNPRKIPKIKSCLNYIKSILYAFKINYQKSQFEEVLCNESVDSGSITIMEHDIRSKVISEASALTKIDTKYYFQKIPDTIKGYLKTLPYVNNKVMFRNLYISCLLTLLSNFTWSNADTQHIQYRMRKYLNIDEFVDNAYKKASTDLILWHLDKSMENYVKVLINKIKNIIKEDLKYIIGDNEPTDQIVKSIISSPLKELIKDEGTYIDEY